MSIPISLKFTKNSQKYFKKKIYSKEKNLSQNLEFLIKNLKMTI